MDEQLERRRVAAYVVQDAPFPALRERWQRAEALGFDAIYLADHTGDYRNLDGHWFEAWTTLAAMATVTTRVRIGPLVANPVLRPPAVVAKAAVTVDHLSGGRLDIGVGTGIAGFDHDAVGVPYWPASAETGKAGLLLLIPDLVKFDMPGLVRAAGYPSTRVVPATSWLLSLLALKLTRTRRVSHVDDLLLADPAAALFAGLSVLPKKSALTDYSYRTSHDNQRAFLAALDAAMIDGGLATGSEAIFDLDFHAVMHWGTDPALEKHYVPTRSQRARSVLTFFAHDTGTHNLVYANADLSKATQAREVIAFCDHWKSVSGADPHMLVMDQKVTTQPVLAELDARGVKFLTLRMRSPALIRHIDGLTPSDYKTITLDRPGRFNRPRVHDTLTRLSNYPGPLRQLIVTGLGRDTPTVIITNDFDSTAKALISRYARRMTIEQRLAEIIEAFHADALSSAVNLNVDLDIMLCVQAQALLAALRQRLPGYAGVTPDVLQRRFLETPGTIITTPDAVTVRLDRRAYAPVLRQADLPNDTTVPWWGNRTLRYEIA